MQNTAVHTQSSSHVFSIIGVHREFTRNTHRAVQHKAVNRVQRAAQQRHTTYPPYTTVRHLAFKHFFEFNTATPQQSSKITGQLQEQIACCPRPLSLSLAVALGSTKRKVSKYNHRKITNSFSLFFHLLHYPFSGGVSRDSLYKGSP